jgi:hypothetical protein
MTNAVDNAAAGVCQLLVVLVATSNQSPRPAVQCSRLAILVISRTTRMLQTDYTGGVDNQGLPRTI